MNAVIMLLNTTIMREESSFAMKKTFEAVRDILLVKDRDYGGSWKKRGGVGAFMNVCRKWDRILNQIETVGGGDPYSPRLWIQPNKTDPFRDDVADLIGYLMLCLSEELKWPLTEPRILRLKSKFNFEIFETLNSADSLEMLKALWDRVEGPLKRRVRNQYNIFEFVEETLPEQIDLICAIAMYAHFAVKRQPKHPYDRDPEEMK